MNGCNGISDIDQIRAKVREQGDIVRRLKQENAPDIDLNKAIGALKAYKKALEDKELELLPKDPTFSRSKLEDLLKQRFFYDQSFAIYGGVQGLYDFGPMGCAMKANLLASWRQFFILEDHLLEVDCSMLTPEPVLQASGHVDRFTDFMVKDMKTGECYRADHLIKAELESIQSNKKTPSAAKEEIERILIQLDNFGAKELQDIILRYNIKSPIKANDLSEPQKFNLMFSTLIGPTGMYKGYLRPETAQGIFVNFQRLLQFNQGRLPFGAAQIGSAFRNEISPRSGLIRVREFTMAEIEYFLDPDNKSHSKFDEVSSVEMRLFSSVDQMNGDQPRIMTIGEAVKEGIVANETLGYFMARIHLFLIHVGVNQNRLRFRQHLSNEMAHYACDCWDAECHTSYGWIECVGCADRSCYDLKQHAKATGTRLVAEKQLAEPHTVQVCECLPNKGAIGKVFRNEAKRILEHLKTLTIQESQSLKQDLAKNGKSTLMIDGKMFEIDNSMVTFKECENLVHVEEIVPNVIEPSFGIGRILYAIFEHSFRVRDGDEQRTYLSIPPVLAPYKCSLLPLSNRPEFSSYIKKLSTELTKVGVSHRIDESSGSVGRRYARTDQIAIPYGITVDFDTVNVIPPSATLRERDSMEQIRVPLDELPNLVSDLSSGMINWCDAKVKYPLFEQQETAQTQNMKQTHVEQLSNEHIDELSLNKKPLSPKFESRKADEADQDAWSSAVEEFLENADSNDKINVHNTSKLTNSEENKQKNFSKHSHEQVHDKKSLSWSDWGKAIRRHYQEEEHREKILNNQKLTNVDPNLRIDTCRDQEEARSNNSGYEADQEDNVGVRSDSIVAPHNLLGSDVAVAENTNIHDKSNSMMKIKDTEKLFAPESLSEPKANLQLSKTPERSTLQCSEGVKPTTPYHGLFAGDNWPGMKKPQIQSHIVSALNQPTKDNLVSKSTKPVGSSVIDKNSTTLDSTKPNSDWVSVLAHLNAFYLESESRQFFEAHSSSITSETTLTSSYDKQSIRTNEKNIKATESVNTESLYHGLFRGDGWPTPKNDKLIVSNKVDSVASQPMKSTIRELDTTSLASEKQLADWSSVVSQISEAHLDAEQFQLNQDIVNSDLFAEKANHSPKLLTEQFKLDKLSCDLDLNKTLETEIKLNLQEKLKSSNEKLNVDDSNSPIESPSKELKSKKLDEPVNFESTIQSEPVLLDKLPESNNVAPYETNICDQIPTNNTQCCKIENNSIENESKENITEPVIDQSHPVLSNPQPNTTITNVDKDKTKKRKNKRKGKKKTN